jgi:hypothetical protein
MKQIGGAARSPKTLTRLPYNGYRSSAKYGHACEYEKDFALVLLRESI